MSGAGWHFIGEEEEALVLDAIRSRSLNRYHGSNVSPSKTEQFEIGLASRIGVKCCLATNSCTSALILGMTALGIGPGDEVLVPGYTFIATIASILHVGATPVLVEINDTLTMDPNDAVRRITSKTKAILVVHMLGTPADMSAFGALAKRYGLLLIEDVAQACGASYGGRHLGGFGCFGAFSFNAFKVITAGDGGALTTNDPKLADKAFSLHDHGFKRSEGGAVDDNVVFGYNLRMNELAAAVVLAQLRKLDKILAHVRKQKAHFIASTGSLPGFRRRRLNDAAGECGTTLVYIADCPNRAKALAKALSSRTLAGSVKHDYRSMRQLNALAPGLYAPGKLPRTDDILDRSIGVGIGVRDDYLGFRFGIDLMDPPERIESVAARFKKETKR